VATARELLEQADALMRRHRARDLEPDIPELTDRVPVAAQERIERRAPASERASSDFRPARATQIDVPELTDVVVDIESLSLQAAPEDAFAVSRWLETDQGEASITGPAPDSIAVVPPATLRAPPREAATGDRDVAASGAMATSATPARPGTAPSPPLSAAATLAATVAGTVAAPPAASPSTGDPAFDAMLGVAPPAAGAPTIIEAAFDEEMARMKTAAPDLSARPAAPDLPAEAAMRGAAAEPAPEPRLAGDAARWVDLAEEIRMQVLQRIDIFTDTDLHDQLTARLQPIVDRASAELVATINQHVGALLRAYVAETIEREIERWRQGNP
jgi:hypothetical protein